jgi:hypothetical protein
MDVDHLNNKALNTRLLLWQKTSDAWNWAGYLKSRIGVSLQRAQQILQGDNPDNGEWEQICAAFDVDNEEYSVAKLPGLDGREILMNNVAHLLRTLPQGGQQKLAEGLTVREETVSRWSSRARPPDRSNILKLLNHFELPADLDLTTVPLFLTLEPLGGYERRAWLHEAVDRLPDADLNRLFPALEKLLRRDENH